MEDVALKIEISQEREVEIRNFMKNFGLQPRSIELIYQSLIHRSFSFESSLGYDNERLEFLGDAVLGFFVSISLYRHNPDSSEGDLSKLKATIVSRSVLGKRAADIGLGKLILLGKGEELSGGRTRASLLGSALEALIGAIYLEMGAEAAYRFIKYHILTPAHKLLQSEEYIDYKSQLQELVQKTFQIVPTYNIVDETGPDHNKLFQVEVEINGEVMGHGRGHRKKIAENLAAREALNYLRRRLGMDTQF